MGKRHNVQVERANRYQIEFFEGSLDDFLSNEHKAREVWEFVEALDADYMNSEFMAVRRGEGRPVKDRRIVLALWIYAISEGIASARCIARLCEEDIGFRWLCGHLNVNHHTLSDFFSGGSKQFRMLLTECLALLMKQDLIDVHRIAVDGTKIRAHAKASSYRREATIQEMIEAAENHIAHLENESKQENTSRRSQAAKLRHARKNQEKRRQALQELEEIRSAKQTDEEKQNARASVTDPESRTMSHGNGGGIHPSYNSQIATDLDSGVIVSAEVTNERNDARGLTYVMDSVEENLGKKPECVVTDGDYVNYMHLDYMDRKGIAFYGNQPERGKKKNSSTSFILNNSKIESQQIQCPNNEVFPLNFGKSKIPGSVETRFFLSQKKCLSCPFYSQCHPQGFRRKIQLSLKTDRFRELSDKHSKRMKGAYAWGLVKKRFQTELPHAVLKNLFNFTQFRVQGKHRARSELLLKSLVHNFLRYRNLKSSY